MSTVYNLITDQSVERLAALSDGLFAIAMTLLVLDLRVPASEERRLVGDVQRVWGASFAGGTGGASGPSAALWGRGACGGCISAVKGLAPRRICAL